jgi:FkbM family methyltransferase
MIGLLNKVASPKPFVSVSKFMYIKSLLDEFDINLILDVGANVGQFARCMRKIGYKGTIISFEPVATEFSKLKKTAANDLEWKVVKSALGATTEVKPINIMRSSSFSSFNVPSEAETSRFQQENMVVGKEEVFVRRLDEIIVEMGLEDNLSRCFLKCDTQGFDKKVLDGAGSFLDAIRLIQIEINVTRIYDEMIGMLDMIGYLNEKLFLPIAFFPINRMRDWGAIDFDYLAVNSRYRKKM